MNNDTLDKLCAKLEAGDEGLKYVRYCYTNPAWASRDMVRMEQEVERLRDGVAAIYGDAEVPDGLPVYEGVKMSPSALITHCKALLQEQGE